jgi:hypothetical protein
VHQIRLLSAHLRSADAGQEERNVILGATGTGCKSSETSTRTQSGDPINCNVLTFAVQGCILTGSNQAITTVIPTVLSPSRFQLCCCKYSLKDPLPWHFLHIIPMMIILADSEFICRYHTEVSSVFSIHKDSINIATALAP